MDGVRWTPGQVEKLATILAAVGQLDTFAGEMGGDLFCPFFCDGDDTDPTSFVHAPDCPITLARDLLAFGREIRP